MLLRIRKIYDFRNFWDFIPSRWIIRIVFHKIFCHIIFRKFFAYAHLNMSNSGFYFSFFVTSQAERTTQVSMWLKRWTGSWTKECEIRIRGWCVDGLNVDDRHVGETYRIDLLQTKYLSWLLNTLPNFFHLDSISIIFMLPKPKIWKIRVYGPISEIFWDLILPRWIIRIVFYKIVCHIIFRKIFAYFNMSNSGLFSFPFL